jgi:hypothetical protein
MLSDVIGSGMVRSKVPYLELCGACMCGYVWVCTSTVREALIEYDVTCERTPPSVFPISSTNLLLPTPTPLIAVLAVAATADAIVICWYTLAVDQCRSIKHAQYQICGHKNTNRHATPNFQRLLFKNS